MPIIFHGPCKCPPPTVYTLDIRSRNAIRAPPGREVAKESKTKSGQAISEQYSD